MIILKTRLIVLVIAVIISIASIAAINSYAGKLEQNAADLQPLILREYQGSVAVYKGDRVLEIFRTVEFNALPEYDKNQLKNGIAFENMEEVYSVIEDFDG